MMLKHLLATPFPHFTKTVHVVLMLLAALSSHVYANVITDENLIPGTANWELANPAESREIEGYASRTSVNRGESIDLFVNTSAATYRVDVFRMGWYQGLGARAVFSSANIPGIIQQISQPDSHGMVNNDWINPVTLVTAHTSGQPWVSGVYLAKLTESVANKQSYIIFVVRDDAREADIAFQLPVTTYQAYNFWGGKSSYDWGSGGTEPWGATSGNAASKLSFNRPYAGSTNPVVAYGIGAGEFLANVQPVAQGYPISSAGWDYNMVRWLEKEGYDVSYITNIDTHQSPELLHNFKVFLSVGHDEYWSRQMRDNLESKLDSGLNLGFFSANTIYWQVRFEADPISGDADRVMVIYKNQNEDPIANDGDPGNDTFTTVLWRDPIVGKSEDALIGVRYFVDRVDSDIVVSHANHPFFDNTGLNNGDRLFGLLGYEVDGRAGNEPSNTITLAASQVGNMVSHMTVYTAPSGATVFATGSMQWNWGLDDFGSPNARTSRLNPDAQQITHNVLKAFGAGVDNAPPIALPDSYTTKISAPLHVPAPGILLNDSDGNPIVAQLKTNVSHGTLDLRTDGSFTYSPNGNFLGNDSFTYIASDGELGSSPARVEINVLTVFLQRCVRIRSLSEVNNNPFTSAAEFRPYGSNGQPIDSAQLSLVSVSTQELVGEDGAATNSFDGDETTIWHTEWTNTPGKHPHAITIDLGTLTELTGLSYLPRQDGGINGTIKDYEIEVSSDCTTWQLAATGSWASDLTEKFSTIDFGDQLVHHWPLDESGGSTIFDQHSGQTAELFGPTRIVGVQSAALQFDGVDDYGQLDLADISPPWTAAMWVRRSSNTSGSTILGSPVAALKLEQWNTANNVGFTRFNLFDRQFNYTAPLDTWVHLAFIGRSTETTLYVNCVLQDTVPASIPLGLSQMGRTSPNVEQLFSALDDIRIYQSALSTTELAPFCSGNPGINNPPLVNAGPDHTVALPNLLNLSGTISDDGLPGGALAINWNLVSGPASVNFNPNTSSITVATFTTPGTYTLRLTANDGELSTNDEIVVIVTPENSVVQASCVRLVAESEVNGNPWTSMAELNLLDNNGAVINQQGWSVYSVNSEETVGENGRAANAVDGNTNTIWHTEWYSTSPTHPHDIHIALNATYALSGFRYLPRQGYIHLNGTIKNYRFFVSTQANCSDWNEIASGSWEGNNSEKEVSF